LVLESRDRIGGRILTNNGIDLGATWFQTHHQRVLELLEALQVEKFHQFGNGRSVLVYSTMTPEHYFETDPNTPTAYRMAGGSSALIRALEKPFSEKIKTNTLVVAISAKDNGLLIETDSCLFKAEKVIVTIPPRIATRISFSPELPDVLTQEMNNTHTWMSNAIKVGMTFESPFWRELNLSGTIIGQVGAVTELYDHSDEEHQNYALMGFVNEGLRDVPSEERKKRIVDYISKYLGEEIMDYLTYEEKDWSQDRHTSCETIKSVYMSPSYGNPIFKETYFDNRLIFSGAETSPVYGGYMDGAIYSGIFAAKKVLVGSSD